VVRKGHFLGISVKNIKKKAFLRHFCKEYKERGLSKAFLSVIVKKLVCTQGNGVRLIRISIRVDVL
jgi:hypothetical protein